LNDGRRRRRRRDVGKGLGWGRCEPVTGNMVVVVGSMAVMREEEMSEE
jgi:hypothetical protein